MLTTPDVIPYLRGRGVLDAGSVVDGGVRVFDASRRNRNFRVVRRDGGSLFLKQGTTREGMNTTSREAAVYALLEGGPSAGGRPRFPFAPRVIDYDPDETVLVLELVDGGTDLRDHHARRPVPSGRDATVLGEALAALHTTMDRQEALDCVGAGEAGVLSAHRPGLALFRDFSGATINLVRMLQAEPEVTDLLDDLQCSWRHDALVHHDVRWDNVLVSGQGGRRRRLVLVDWETAAVGDPAWDLGAALGEYLSHWLMSIPSVGREAPHRALHLAGLPLTACWPAARALWHSYRRSRPEPEEGWPALLERSVRCTGLKLLQSGLEQSQGTAHETVTAVCHLQVAVNVMKRPADAARVLLGLEAA